MPWQVFTDREQFGCNTRCIAMIHEGHVPDDAEQVYADDACIIYRYAGIMFQIDKHGEITVIGGK